MNALDQIIADALAGSPETHVAMLAREVVRLREAPAVVALRRFAERCAQRDHQPDEHIGRAKCVACEAEDALRTHQGGADHD